MWNTAGDWPGGVRPLHVCTGAAHDRNKIGPRRCPLVAGPEDSIAALAAVDVSIRSAVAEKASMSSAVECPAAAESAGDGPPYNTLGRSHTLPGRIRGTSLHPVGDSEIFGLEMTRTLAAAYLKMHKGYCHDERLYRGAEFRGTPQYFVGGR